jgi:capsular exopolysaccharide synthesis family protein
MSRIYEALQRAESERNLEREENTGGVLTRDPAVDPPLPPLQPVPVRVSMPHTAPHTIGSHAAVAESHDAPHLSTEPLLWDHIQEQSWHLSVEKLPAIEQRGPAVEQFRSLRSRVQEFRTMNRLKSLLVSSGMPQEGKSFIAANLAIGLALHKNNKVLLVDGDMRRSTLQDYFGCSARPGLADYLAGRAEVIDVMQRPSMDSKPSQAIAPIFNNFVLIPGGSGGDKAADLAGSPRFEELLRRAESLFDWIIIDSSPVLPVSDSVSMGSACDAVLLVARSGVTTFPVAQRAKHELKASNIIGFVLNAVENPPALNSYYAYESNTE